MNQERETNIQPKLSTNEAWTQLKGFMSQNNLPYKEYKQCLNTLVILNQEGATKEPAVDNYLQQVVAPKIELRLMQDLHFLGTTLKHVPDHQKTTEEFKTGMEAARTLRLYEDKSFRPILEKLRQNYYPDMPEFSTPASDIDEGQPTEESISASATDKKLDLDEIKIGEAIDTEDIEWVQLSGQENESEERDRSDAYINKEALNNLTTDLSLRGSKIEAGGAVLGYIYTDSQTNKTTTRVSHYLSLPEHLTPASRTAIRFTPDAWTYATLELEKLREELHNPQLIIVGWAHSHPGYGVFLSKDDHFVNKFFQEPGQIAIVYDPTKKELGIFSKGGTFIDPQDKASEESLFRKHRGFYATTPKTETTEPNKVIQSTAKTTEAPVPPANAESNLPASKESKEDKETVEKKQRLITQAMNLVDQVITSARQLGAADTEFAREIKSQLKTLNYRLEGVNRNELGYNAVSNAVSIIHQNFQPKLIAIEKEAASLGMNEQSHRPEIERLLREAANEADPQKAQDLIAQAGRIFTSDTDKILAKKEERELARSDIRQRSSENKEAARIYYDKVVDIFQDSRLGRMEDLSNSIPAYFREKSLILASITEGSADKLSKQDKETFDNIYHFYQEFNSIIRELIGEITNNVNKPAEKPKETQSSFATDDEIIPEHQIAAIGFAIKYLNQWNASHILDTSQESSFVTELSQLYPTLNPRGRRVLKEQLLSWWNRHAEKGKINSLLELQVNGPSIPEVFEELEKEAQPDGKTITVSSETNRQEQTPINSSAREPDFLDTMTNLTPQQRERARQRKAEREADDAQLQETLRGSLFLVNNAEGVYLGTDGNKDPNTEFVIGEFADFSGCPVYIKRPKSENYPSNEQRNTFFKRVKSQQADFQQLDPAEQSRIQSEFDASKSTDNRFKEYLQNEVLRKEFNQLKSWEA